jgi:hypothetical protein
LQQVGGLLSHKSAELVTYRILCSLLPKTRSAIATKWGRGR